MLLRRDLLGLVGNFIALFVLACSLWLSHRVTSAQYPLTDYCGVGVCSRDLPDRFLDGGSSSLSLARAIDALSKNPAFPYAWSDVAETACVAGESQISTYAFRQARRYFVNNLPIRTQLMQVRCVSGRSN